MYHYMPLSIDAVKSASRYEDLGKEAAEYAAQNVINSILYKGDDCALTNWAKSNTLNMLHLCRFIRKLFWGRYSIKTPFSMSDNFGALSIDEVEYNLTEDEEGFLKFDIGTTCIRMNVKKKNKTRDEFLITAPFTITSNEIMESSVWYSRLYQFCKHDKTDLLYLLWQPSLIKELDIEEMYENFFQVTQQLPEIL